MGETTGTDSERCEWIEETLRELVCNLEQAEMATARNPDALDARASILIADANVRAAVRALDRLLDEIWADA